MDLSVVAIHFGLDFARSAQSLHIIASTAGRRLI